MARPSFRLVLATLATLGAGVHAQSKQTAAELLSEGRKRFEIRCAACHGADGNGGERAPGIGQGDRGRLRSEQDIRELIRKGIPGTGMPAFPLPEEELTKLVAFVRSRISPAVQSSLGGDAKAGET